MEKKCQYCGRLFFPQTTSTKNCYRCSGNSSKYKKIKEITKKCIRCGVLISRKSKFCKPCSADVREEQGKLRNLKV